MIATIAIGKKIKRLWLWLLKKDVLIFLLFVGLVSIFWWGRTMSSPRDMEIHIPITYNGLTEQFVLSKTLPQSITATVRDNGQQLRKIRQNDLHLSINITPYLSSSEGRIALTADILRPRLQDLLPGSTAIQQILPEIIESDYYVQQMKTVPVVVQSQVNVAPQHQLVGEAITTPNQIQIYGNQEDISHIDYILTDSIFVSDLRDNIRLETQLQVPEGIRVSSKSVQVEWQAEQFTEKSFTLPIQVLDMPEGMHIRLFPQQIHVTVRVGISHFEMVHQNDLQAFCHYPIQQCNALPVEVTTTNTYISNIRFSPTSVEYMIQF